MIQISRSLMRRTHMPLAVGLGQGGAALEVLFDLGGVLAERALDLLVEVGVPAVDGVHVLLVEVLAAAARLPPALALGGHLGSHALHRGPRRTPPGRPARAPRAARSSGMRPSAPQPPSSP